MKKTVILILAILPIFLLITISIAGRILASYSFISVEKVYFVDNYQDPLPQNNVIKLKVNDIYQTEIKILPTLSTDKKVTYHADNLNVCEIDDNGLIKAKATGSSLVVVKTHDGNKTATLFINVADENVTSVDILQEEVELIVGENLDLTYAVTPSTALNKDVSWSSSDNNIVKVNSNGQISAISEGRAVVTVTTKDGGFTDSVIINCVKGVLPVNLDFSKADFITSQGSAYVTSKDSIDLDDYLVVDETKFNKEDVKFEITSGGAYAEVNTENMLIINEKNKPIKLVVYVGSLDNPTYKIEIMIVYRN